MHDRISLTDEVIVEAVAPPRKANECFTDPKPVMPPALLFDEFWREGELALMFGAAGTGKSVLAVQIAEAIARGRSIDGFTMQAKRQKVLYVDLKLADKPFRLRYAVDGRYYKFSENLFRERPPTNDALCEWLRQMIAAHGFRVVVIDDLSVIRQTYDGTRDTLRLMRDLRELKEELGVSVLVLASSREPGRSGVVSEADMLRSRILCDAADSVFGIGRCGAGGDERHLVQTRSQSAAVSLHFANSPVGRLERTDDGFLGLKFDERFAAGIDEATRRLICEVKQRHDDGSSYRQIADDLDITRSRATRLYQKWTSEMGRLAGAGAEDDLDDCDDDEFDDDDLPKEAYQGEFTDRYLVSTGGRPIWKEKWEAETRAALSVPEAVATGDPSVSSVPSVVELPEETLTTEHTESTEPDDKILENAGLTLELTPYGKEIFVEKFDSRGKPKIWYRYDSKHLINRHVRDLFGSTGTIVEGPMEIGKGS